MQIWIDSREHKSELQRITKQFDKLGIKYFINKLLVGDYMSLDNPRVVIDRKKDLQEIIGNVTQEHERFKRELLRAKESGIKLIVLCEHGDDIEELEDVIFWENPRSKMTEWVVQDGHPVKVKKYPKATSGQALYKSLVTIRDRYGVEFYFCDKRHTGKRIMELLGGDSDG